MIAAIRVSMSAHELVGWLFAAWVAGAATGPVLRRLARRWGR